MWTAALDAGRRFAHRVRHVLCRVSSSATSSLSCSISSCLIVAHAAERHGDVRALAPAVDVQLVHHQERQLASHARPGSMPDDAG